MREKFSKRFALIFSLLLILQECHSMPNSPFDNFEFQNDDPELREPEIINIGRQNVPEVDTTGFASDFSVTTDKQDLKIEQDFDKLLSPEIKYHDDLKTEEKAIATIPRKSKRFVGLLLIGISAMSAVVDVYKYIAGCRHAAPDLEKNVLLGQRLQKDFLERRKQLNLVWATVDGMERYLQRLSTEMNVMKPLIARMDSLQIDIVNLLDASILNKIDLSKRRIENAIDRANETEVLYPEKLRAKAFTAGSLALTLVLKLAPLGLWLGLSVIPNLIAKRADSILAQIKSGNKKSLGFRDNALVRITLGGRKIKASLAKLWNKMVNKLPPSLTKIKTKLTVDLNKQGEQAAKTKTKMTKTKIFGSVIVGALFLAYEAYSVYKFVQDCKDREKNSYSMLEKLKSGLHNLSIAESNITILRNDIEKNYKKLFHDLTAESFGKFVKEAIQTANNAEKQTKSLKQGAEQLKEFYFNINKTWTSDGKINFNRVEKLVTTLNSGLSKQTYKLTCMRKKLSIIKTITDSCANGLGSYESLWNASRQLEGKTLQNCIENNQYLTQKGVEAVIAGAMEARGKNLKCVRNDKNKFQLACQKWLEDAPNSKIMESLDDVDLEDVKYFISKCPPGEVNSQMTGTICSFKEDNTKKIDSVYNRFPKYDRTGLLKTWNLCPLSTIQRSSICSNKASMYSFPYIRSKYLNYDEADVQNVYQNCVLVMNPQTKFMVCMIYNNGGLDNSMMKRYITLYGLAAIKAYVTGPNCKADQSFGKR